MPEARDQFLAANGFRVEDYTAPMFTIRISGVPFKYPNTKAHRWATPLHDMHHLLTEYGTDWIGEAEMAAWELRAGCKTLIVYWLDLGESRLDCLSRRSESGGRGRRDAASARFIAILGSATQSWS